MLPVVCTYCAGDWDSPMPGGEKNYIIHTPGTYYLQSGQLSRHQK